MPKDEYGIGTLKLTDDGDSLFLVDTGIRRLSRLLNSKYLQDMLRLNGKEVCYHLSAKDDGITLEIYPADSFEMTPIRGTIYPGGFNNQYLVLTDEDEIINIESKYLPDVSKEGLEVEGFYRKHEDGSFDISIRTKR